MRFCLIIVLFLSIPTTFFAQQVKKVEGAYTYYASEEVSLDRAKRIALERAQLEAVAEAFGTDISQHNSTRISNMNGQSDIDFLSISSSDIKGEWIETIGEPLYNITYEQNMLVVKCSVRGKAREIATANIDLRVKVLRNGTEDKFESNEFHSGDDLYLLFQSPIDGYLAVYLIDNESNAYCLLPYRNQTDGIYNIKANTSYVFFSEAMAPVAERHVVDEYVLTCEQSQETNQLFLVFSPCLFVKANDDDKGEALPRVLSWEKLQKWYSKQREIHNNIFTINQLLTIKN